MWNEELTRAVTAYNTTRHVELGMSPSEYLLSQSHPIISSPILGEDCLVPWKASHLNYVPFSVGQLVKKKVVIQNRCVSSKFKPRYEGPFRVITVNKNKVTYVIQHVHDGHVVNAHHKQLAPWRVTPKYILDEPESTLEQPSTPVPDTASACITRSDSDTSSSYVGSDSDDSFEGFSVAEVPSPATVKSDVFSFTSPTMEQSIRNQGLTQCASNLPDDVPVNNTSPSGVVLPLDVDSWSLSTVQGHGTLNMFNPILIEGNENREDSKPVTTLDSESAMITDMFRTTFPELQSSFSGFSDRNASVPAEGTSVELVSSPPPTLDLPTEQRRICTRSQGEVASHPHVQPRPLEYVLSRRKST